MCVDGLVRILNRIARADKWMNQSWYLPERLAHVITRSSELMESVTIRILNNITRFVSVWISRNVS